MSEQSFEMIAKTFQGLEVVLAQELTALGANEIEIGRRMLSFSIRMAVRRQKFALYIISLSPLKDTMRRPISFSLAPSAVSSCASTSSSPCRFWQSFQKIVQTKAKK